MLLYGDEPRAEPEYFMANHQHYHDNLTVISAMAARVAGVSGAGIRWLAKRALMVQPLGWSMYCSGEVRPRPLDNEHTTTHCPTSSTTAPYFSPCLCLFREDPS